MRIDHLLVTTSLRHRVVWAEIDREARKGKPIPSDQAQLVMGFVHAFQKKTQKTPPHELAVGEKFKGSDPIFRACFPLVLAAALCHECRERLSLFNQDMCCLFAGDGLDGCESEGMEIQPAKEVLPFS